MSASEEPSTSDASRRERMLQIMDEQRHSRPIPEHLRDSLQWDPRRNQQATSEEDSPPAPIRVGSKQWCTCGSCVMMPTEAESKCCQELPNIRRILKRRVNYGRSCICEVHYLKNKLTRKWHLKELYRFGVDFAWTLLTPLAEFQESDYRKVAYRAFTLWVHGPLGARNRRVIPACTVNLIRTHYPAPDQVYLGFIPVTSDPNAADMLE